MAPTYQINHTGNHSHSIATTSWVQSTFKATFNHTNGKDTITVDDMIDFMNIMKKRMCIIDDAIEKHEKFPALKEAYENYKLIERLCCGDDNDE